MPDIAWLRPEWFWGLLPFLLLCVFVWRRQSQTSEWQALIDPALQPYVLESGGGRSKVAPILCLLFCFLALLLLAGPVWEQRDVPTYKQQQAQVVLFDLSASMLADDLKPSRLVRARFKLLDLIERSNGVQMGLIAFSERPYVISPLSDDADTLGAFVESLSPEIMPIGGSRTDLAVDKAISLLEQAGATDGQIILISDTSVDGSLRKAGERVRDAGFKLSILGAGTSEGAPLRNEAGQFVKDKNGVIVLPRVVLADYQALVAISGGRAVLLADDDDDIDVLLLVQTQLELQDTQNSAKATTLEAVNWVEYSPYAIPLLMLLMLPLFRRGASL